MHEVLNYAKRECLPRVPEVTLEADHPCAEGYLPGGLLASVEVPDESVEGVCRAVDALDEVQRLVVTPEVLAGVLGGTRGVVEGIPVIRYPGGDGRAEYVGRLGPTVESGSVAVYEVASVASRFQSVLVFVGEGGDPTPDD